MKRHISFLLLGLVASAHLASAQWVHETSGELAVAADWDGDGLSDLLVVDRASGILRAGMQESSGNFLWSEPQATGPEQVTAIGLGTFFGSTAPTLAVTSPTLNRLNLIRIGEATAEPWFVNGIGPRAFALTQGGPNGVGGDLFIATSDNGTPSPHRLENWKFPSQLAGSDSALARGQAVGTAGDLAFLARGTNALLFYPNGDLTFPTVADGIPLDADWAWGNFGAVTQSFLFWEPLSPTLTLRPFNRFFVPLAFDAAVDFTLSGPIYSVTVLNGGGLPRLFIVFSGGTSAGVFTFDGENAPVLVQSFTPPPDGNFRTVLPLDGGDFALFSGPPGGNTSTTAHRHRHQSDGSYLADPPSFMTPLPAFGLARTNVLLFSSEPFISSTAQLFSALRARDWSVNTDGLPGSLNVLAETYRDSQSGLGARQSVALGVPNASSQSFALANQYAADLSISTPAPATGAQPLTVTLTPPPGVYSQALTVLASSTPPGVPIYYRQTAGGAWNLFDPAGPATLAITASGFLEIYARNGFAKSPIFGGTYTIGTISPSPLGGPDLDGDGIGDTWSKYFGTPASTDDKDNDGFTTAQEYAAGTDPCDPESHPGTTDPGKPFLRITAIDPPPTGLLHFRLSGKPGVRHAVQASTTLAPGQWSGFINEFTMPASGFYDFTAPYQPEPRRFFRGLAR